MTFQDYLGALSETASAAFSCVALYFTWRVYRRENTLNNEDFIYQKKHETYEKLFSSSLELVNAAENALACLRVYKSKNTEFSEEEYFDAIDKYGDLEEQAGIDFMKNSIVIPRSIIDEFVSLLDRSIWKDQEDEKKWDELINYYTDKLDKIRLKVKKDLHMATLNNGLFRRLNNGKSITERIKSQQIRIAFEKEKMRKIYEKKYGSISDPKFQSKVNHVIMKYPDVAKPLILNRKYEELADLIHEKRGDELGSKTGIV
jgi:hypothetical protein